MGEVGCLHSQRFAAALRKTPPGGAGGRAAAQRSSAPGPKLLPSADVWCCGVVPQSRTCISGTLSLRVAHQDRPPLPRQLSHPKPAAAAAVNRACPCVPVGAGAWQAGRKERPPLPGTTSLSPPPLQPLTLQEDGLASSATRTHSSSPARQAARARSGFRKTGRPRSTKWEAYPQGTRLRAQRAQERSSRLHIVRIINKRSLENNLAVQVEHAKLSRQRAPLGAVSSGEPQPICSFHNSMSILAMPSSKKNSIKGESKTHALRKRGAQAMMHSRSGHYIKAAGRDSVGDKQESVACIPAGSWRRASALPDGRGLQPSYHAFQSCRLRRCPGDINGHAVGASRGMFPQRCTSVGVKRCQRAAARRRSGGTVPRCGGSSTPAGLRPACELLQAIGCGPAPWLPPSLHPGGSPGPGHARPLFLFRLFRPALSCCWLPPAQAPACGRAPAPPAYAAASRGCPP